MKRGVGGSNFNIKGMLNDGKESRCQIKKIVPQRGHQKLLSACSYWGFPVNLLCHRPNKDTFLV